MRTYIYRAALAPLPSLCALSPSATHLTVLCHTTGKLVTLAKFCVTATVSSRLRTTCHHPPGMNTVSPGFCRISSWVIHRRRDRRTIHSRHYTGILASHILGTQDVYCSRLKRCVQTICYNVCIHSQSCQKTCSDRKCESKLLLFYDKLYNSYW